MPTEGRIQKPLRCASVLPESILQCHWLLADIEEAESSTHLGHC